MVLAMVAALLPSSTEQKQIQDLKIEYDLKSQPFLDFGDESVLDFLKFQLKPTVVAPRGEIIRSREPSNKKISIGKPVEAPVLTSPPEFTVVLEDNTAEILEKINASVKQEKEIRYEAIKNNNPDDCAMIDSARAEMDCRGEIYFQKAIFEKDITLCGKIGDPKLKTRCENYLNLNF